MKNADAIVRFSLSALRHVTSSVSVSVSGCICESSPTVLCLCVRLSAIIAFLYLPLASSPVSSFTAFRFLFSSLICCVFSLISRLYFRVHKCKFTRTFEMLAQWGESGGKRNGNGCSWAIGKVQIRRMNDSPRDSQGVIVESRYGAWRHLTPRATKYIVCSNKNVSAFALQAPILHYDCIFHFCPFGKFSHFSYWKTLNLRKTSFIFLNIDMLSNFEDNS